MMDIVALVQRLPCWGGEAVKVSELKGGLSNLKYLVDTKHGRHVARFLGREQAKYLELNRPREVVNTRHAHKLGLAPRVVAHYPQHHVLVVEYIAGRALNKRMLQLPANVRATGKLLARLHAEAGFRGYFSAVRSIARFERQLKRDGRTIPLSGSQQRKLAYCSDVIRARRVQLVRCHVDPMPQNFLHDGSKLRLIDWEYACMGDGLWDLAFVAAVGRFSVPTCRMLLVAHGTTITPRLWREFSALRALVYYREALWARTQIGRSQLAGDYRGYLRHNLSWFAAARLDKKRHFR